MKKIPILLFIILLLSGIASAAGEYYYPGYDTKSVSGPSWTSPTYSESFASTTNSPSYTTPLVGDLDSDGTNEIVLIDGKNVEVYQDKTLTGLAGKEAEDAIEHAILYDIDGDSDLEVLTVGGDKVSIFSFNGTALNLDLNLTPASLAAADNQYELGCRGVDDCILINARTKDGVPSTETLDAYYFNTSNITARTSLLTSQNNGDFTLPKIRSVIAEDYDLDGDTEYIVTAYDYGYTNIRIAYINVTGSSIGTELTIGDTDASAVGSDTGRDDFTSALVAELDPTSSGMETVVAFQSSSTHEFEMKIYSASGVEIDDYPELTYTEGVIISNVVQAQVFDDTSGSRDFCVMGYDTVQDEMNLLCGTTLSGSIWTDSTEFNIEDVTYDLSETDYFPSNILHAVQVSSSTTGGQDLNEFLTPYGLYSLDFEYFNELIPVYEFSTVQDGIAVPSDVESVGRFDILYQTTDGLYYLDDGFENAQADITSITRDASPWCANRTYTLRVYFDDPEGNSVTCWLENTDESGTSLWNSTNKTGSSSVTFYYKTNVTGLMFLDVYCTDGVDPTPEHELLDAEVTTDTDVCHVPGSATVSEEYEDQDAEGTSQDEALTAGFSDFFTIFGYSGVKGLALVALCIISVCALLVHHKTKSIIMAIASIPISTFACTLFGIIGIFPLVLFTMICCVIGVWMFFNNRGAGG